VLLTCLFAAALTVGAGFIFGVLPRTGGHDSARPPCEQLPDKASVVAAVAAHGDMVTQIQHVGPGVRVEVTTPCTGQPDRAIVSIKYATDAEWQDVDAILRHEGFGVAAELVRK
jgi:hypothetical protein